MAFFDTQTSKGELFDLEQELSSDEFEVKLYAVKKIIANMTVGKDVSPLFQSVLKCLQYPDMQLKKLVYLYIINYSRDKPDDSIMVVNLFRKDMENKANPMLRALAVRTIGCLRVHKLNEYLVPPLKNCLEDEEPYVRKTAALCVSKVYEVSPKLVEEAGLIQMMQALLGTETNGLVLANLLLALQEISFIKGELLPTINSQNLKKLLIAINECSEWGQIFLLDQLADYTATLEEAEQIIERVLPRLNHINPAVVLSAVKVVLKFLVCVQNSQLIDTIMKKLTPSLVSLLNWDKPEVKFVILKSILHILQRKPNIMESKLKSFFCNFNEPYYVKNEKLDVLVRICNEKNFDDLLAELATYVTESDTEFVKKSIRALGSIAVRFDKACEKAFSILMELIKNIQNTSNLSSCQEQIREILITLQKIFRKHRVITPKNRETMKLITSIMSEAYDTQSKASAAWIVGEYAEYIDDSLQLIQVKAENFSQEERLVQLEILTAAVKIFVKYPQDSQNLIISLLQVAAEESQSPDVRDRAYMYWRMLATDPKKTQDTVLCNKPKIEEQKVISDPEFIEKMIITLGCVSSVFSRLPEELFKHENIMRRKPIKIDFSQIKKAEGEKQESTSSSSEKSTDPKPPTSAGNIDLLDIGDLPHIPTAVSPQKQQATAIIDLIDEPSVVHVKPVVTSGIDLYDLADSHASPQQNTQVQQQQQINVPLSPAFTASPSVPQQQQPQTVQVDMFGDPIEQPQNHPQLSLKFTEVPPEEVLKSDSKGNGGSNGLSVLASFGNEDNSLYLQLTLANTTLVPISNFLLQIKQNFFGLKPESIPASLTVQPGSSQNIRVRLSTTGNKDQNLPSVPLMFTVGLKCSLDVFLFQVPCLFHIFMQPDGETTKEEFKKGWTENPELSFEIKNNLNSKFFIEDNIKSHLKANNFFHVATRQSPNGMNAFFFSSKSLMDSSFYIEVTQISQSSSKVTCKSKSQSFIPLVLQVFNFLLTRP